MKFHDSSHMPHKNDPLAVCVSRIEEKLHFPNVTVLTPSRIFSRLVVLLVFAFFIAESSEHWRNFHSNNRLFCSTFRFPFGDYPFSAVGLCSSLWKAINSIYLQQYTIESEKRRKRKMWISTHISSSHTFPAQQFKNWIPPVQICFLRWKACGALVMMSCTEELSNNWIFHFNN